ncbi:MAG: STAS-like domain-containing protein [Rhodoferax sp.]|nr:STAS-like domain-containing protein [Rhodoferax sp.]MDP3655168.1 STAS-like domain-containing protein [Rhodoferax sp.]
MKIDIAKDFSPVPLGRFPDDSPFNGTTFREKILLPALKQFSRVQVVFDGAEGYGSSFLEEAFGGLIRHEGLNESDLIRQLELISIEDPTVIDEVLHYLHEAETLLSGNSDSGNRPKGG